MDRSPTDEEKRIERVLTLLAAAYPDVKPGLNFETPFELLIATILSAQCTDARVNKITPALFARYPDAEALARCPASELEVLIHACGMYRTKAANIKKTCEALATRYGGAVPDTREALEKLPGVGRKTASVVLSNAFGVPAIAVDTHVFRVSNRLGLVHANTVEKTEKQLMEAIPRDKWSIAHHWLIWHGRRVCHARGPECARCPLAEVCENPVLQKARETENDGFAV